jgi:hypothetical protein
VIAILIGFLTVRALGSGPRGWCRHDIFRLVLGTGLGIGLCSICYFLGLMAGIPGLLLELSVLVAAAAAVVLRWKNAVCPFCESASRPSPNRTLMSVLGLTLGLLLLLDIAAFISTTVHSPDGVGDATAIWNLRARFLYRGGGAWYDGFTELVAWSHPDYPLLVPAFIAGAWKLLGSEAQAVPIALACFFSFGLAGLMMPCLAALRGTGQGLLAGVALAATPVIYIQGAMQYADVPLAFFVFATLATMAMAEHFKESGYAVLAGASSALAAWTKNEGLLWLVAFMLARLIVARRRLLGPFLAGVTPVLAVILLFKARVATSSGIFGPSGRVGMAGRLLDPSRYVLIVHEAIKHAWQFGPLLVNPLLILAAYLAVTGIRNDERDRAVRRTGALALVFIAGGYFATYVVQPYPLEWELNHSMDRLLLQIWPAVVFSVFLAARAPRPEPAGSQLEDVNTSFARAEYCATPSARQAELAE